MSNFLGRFFHLFVVKKIKNIFFENIVVSALKSCILMAVWISFLCSPNCPKQPRTSFPFYEFFYTIISAKVSVLQIQDYFLSTGFLLWPALIWFIELSSIIKWRFSHEKKAKEGRKGKLFIDLCCIFLHNIQIYTVEPGWLWNL